MRKIFYMGLLAFLFLSSSSFAYDLKSNMQQLNNELRDIQLGFIMSNKESLKGSVDKFAEHAQELLGNKKKFAQMLPKDKQYKANEAVMSAQIISHNVQIILDAISNKYNQSGKIRREESQRAYTYIEHACFRCHNIVRDNY